ncbi:Dipeptide transport system permease protein DppB [subsurface metagenome]
MQAYIIRRLLLVIPTLFFMSLIIFFSIRLIPGDIIDLMVAEMEHFTLADRAHIEHQLGFDLPIHVQYGRWMGDLIMHGSLGQSLWTDEPVTDEIIRRFPVTAELGVLAMIAGLIIALPVGVYSAIRQDTVGDYIGRSFAIMCIAMPTFWIGTLVVVFPAIWWGWSPPILILSFTEDPMGNLAQFIVPAVIVGMALSGTVMRMTRTMMLEVLRQDYIRTAWAKGLRERTVVMRHALKNALIPVVTILGLQVAVVIGGTVIVEQIFCLPGIGRLLVQSLNQRDYPLVSGAMLFIGLIMLIVNLVVDLSYGFLDPRVKYR